MAVTTTLPFRFFFCQSFSSLDILFKVVIGVILLLIMMTLPFWFYQIYLCIAGEIINVTF